MKPRSERFYDRLVLTYPLIDLFLTPQKQKMIRMINACPPGRLLDIGVGNGSHLKYYAGHEIVGIDTSARMLAVAKKRDITNIRLDRMNAESLEFADCTFDYAVLSHVIAVADDPVKVLDEVHRTLRPGGKVFILNHFTPDNYCLKYFDRSMEWFARRVHLRSFFRISEIHSLNKFTLLMATPVGLFSYFKILIYEKSV